MQMKKNNEKGITLIVLIVTIIIMLILTAVAVTTIINGNILARTGKAANSASERSSTENEMKENMEEEWNEKPAEIKSGTVYTDTEWIDTIIEINAKVSTYNESLGTFPTVYSLVGKLNEKIVYEDIAYINIDSASLTGIGIRLNTYLPENTEITVTEVYSGASYSLTTENNLKQTVQKESEESNKTELTFSFLHEYNGGNRGNAVGMVVRDDDKYFFTKENSAKLSRYTLASSSNNYSNNIKRVVSSSSGVVKLGCSIEIPYNGSVLNTAESSEAWVRIKIFVTPRATYSTTGLEKSNDWEKNVSDEYYYYLALLGPGMETKSFHVIPESDYFHEKVKTIIVAECTPVIYDAEGNPSADWTSNFQ